MKRAGAKTSALVELLDLYPTLVDLCGLPPVAVLEGVSLRRVIEQPSVQVKSAAFTQAPRPPNIQGGRSDTMGYSMRTERHRYTEWREWATGHVQSRELYDHATDPDEMINVANARGQAGLVGELAKQLAKQFPPKPLP